MDINVNDRQEDTVSQGTNQGQAEAQGNVPPMQNVANPSVVNREQLPFLPQNANNAGSGIQPKQVKIIIVLLIVILAVGIAQLVISLVPSRPMAFGGGAPAAQSFGDRAPGNADEPATTGNN